jgi:hypothetical protein
MFSGLKVAAVPVFLFWICLAAVASPAVSPMTTGLEGQIRIGPFPGGPIHQGMPNSRPLPDTVFVVKQEEKIVATFQTDKEGGFHLSLPPGKYQVSKKDWGGRIGHFGPFEVDIVAGQVKKVQWECDSGMQ